MLINIGYAAGVDLAAECFVGGCIIRHASADTADFGKCFFDFRSDGSTAPNIDTAFFAGLDGFSESKCGFLRIARGVKPLTPTFIPSVISVAASSALTILSNRQGVRKRVASSISKTSFLFWKFPYLLTV